ncbi:tRNA-splicing ligase RtcB homolog [Striga asiatica]|uniref:tRNA-splicing ligase RtcB homolog n=1 Tax=Striga asiatica TaxID=4170 RepID=A0A5A7R2J3_STRAF|nr:tRNA-splicing ligase RtcB homolog [Striga asiatica]
MCTWEELILCLPHVFSKENTVNLNDLLLEERASVAWRWSLATGDKKLVLSLRVVHKQAAASNSTSPDSIGQHLFTAGPMWTSPPSRSTHAPNFRVSMGQPPLAGGSLGTVVTGGLGFTVTGGTGNLGTTTGEQVAQLVWRMGSAAEERESMEMRRIAKILADSIAI